MNVEHSPNGDDNEQDNDNGHEDYHDDHSNGYDCDGDDNACLMRATATRAASDASRAVRRHG